ncbi:MAG TPA: hypothetical protein VN429_00840 [Methanospirillum sp.]|nr:hypothetical protein [Methanospirillum sp.]
MGVDSSSGIKQVTAEKRGSNIVFTWARKALISFSTTIRASVNLAWS